MRFEALLRTDKDTIRSQKENGVSLENFPFKVIDRFGGSAFGSLVALTTSQRSAELIVACLNLGLGSKDYE